MTKKLALVTGASSGIGLELAKLFFDNDFDVIAPTESEADLSTPEGVEKAYELVRRDGRPLAAAALNAGVGHGGAFVSEPLDAALHLIDLNVRGTVHLAKLVLDDMVVEGVGKLLVTSSVASTLPGPYHAVYNASKSFLQSFTEGLQGELPAGVTVTALMPGGTATNFFHRASMDNTWMGQNPTDSPVDVARDGFEAMLRGDRKVVAHSLVSKAMVVLDSITPDAVKAAAHKVMALPRG